MSDYHPRFVEIRRLVNAIREASADIGLLLSKIETVEMRDAERLGRAKRSNETIHGNADSIETVVGSVQVKSLGKP